MTGAKKPWRVFPAGCSEILIRPPAGPRFLLALVLMDSYKAGPPEKPCFCHLGGALAAADRLLRQIRPLIAVFKTISLSIPELRLPFHRGDAQGARPGWFFRAQRIGFWSTGHPGISPPGRVFRCSKCLLPNASANAGLVIWVIGLRTAMMHGGRRRFSPL